MKISLSKQWVKAMSGERGAASDRGDQSAEVNYKRGEHPASQSNLRHTGRPVRHGEKKRRRNVVVTDGSWERLPERVAAVGAPSVSELLDRLAQDRVMLVEISEEMQAAIGQLSNLAERQAYLAGAIEGQLRSDGLLQPKIE